MPPPQPPAAPPSSLSSPSSAHGPTASPLLALPAELLSHVAFFCALSPAPGPPSGLLPLLRAHPRIAACLSPEADPTLYARILRSTWDLAAVRRRYGADVFGSMRDESRELRRRWKVLQTVRAVGADVGGWLRAHGKAGERVLEEAMVEVYLLLMENDGRNLPHILGWARLPLFLLRLHETVTLPTALQPGFPVDSVWHACHCTLTVWALEAGEILRQANLSIGQDVTEETDEQTQEKTFVLRPLVFLPQYSLYFAPWNARSLPLTTSDARKEPPVATDNLWSQASVTYAGQRFGRQWSIKPPKLGRAAILGLLNSLDTDPSIGGVTTTASNSSTASLEFLYMPEELAADVPGRTPEFDPVSGTYLRRSVPIFNLHSRSFDNDWHRASRCKTLDDVGMRVSDWRGKFEGTWVGSFAYFDFNGFAEILAGDHEAVYTNAFGQQANLIELTEKIVYVPRADVGGTGPAFAAGYPADADDVSRPCPVEEEDLDDEPGSEWVKELLVTGTGRSKWGKFTYRGRVRAWDGLLTVEKAYLPNDQPITQAVSRKWLYRGYIMADSRWIGKWRDTYTTEETLSYEGPFCLRKQADPYLLPLRRSALRSSSMPQPQALTAARPPALSSTSIAAAAASKPRPMDVASFEAAMARRVAADLSAASSSTPLSLAGDAHPAHKSGAASRAGAEPEASLKRDWSVASDDGFPETTGGPKRARGDEDLLRPSSAASAASASSSSSTASPRHATPRRITIASLLSDSPSPGPADDRP